jgi:uncharacterized protein
MKLVIDTNVFVAGIFWYGPPYTILEAWQAKKIHVAMTTDILDEYNRVAEILQKKYPRVHLTSIIEWVTRYTEVCYPAVLSKPISIDPDDDKFIACALAAKANYIISGDKDLLDVSGVFGIQVVKPRAFVDQFLTVRMNG